MADKRFAKISSSSESDEGFQDKTTSSHGQTEEQEQMDIVHERDDEEHVMESEEIEIDKEDEEQREERSNDQEMIIDEEDKDQEDINRVIDDSAIDLGNSRQSSSSDDAIEYMSRREIRDPSPELSDDEFEPLREDPLGPPSVLQMAKDIIIRALTHYAKLQSYTGLARLKRNLRFSEIQAYLTADDPHDPPDTDDLNDDILVVAVQIVQDWKLSQMSMMSQFSRREPEVPLRRGVGLVGPANLLKVTQELLGQMDEFSVNFVRGGDNAQQLKSVRTMFESTHSKIKQLCQLFVDAQHISDLYWALSAYYLIVDEPSSTPEDNKRMAWDMMKNVIMLTRNVPRWWYDDVDVDEVLEQNQT